MLFRKEEKWSFIDLVQTWQGLDRLTIAVQQIATDLEAPLQHQPLLVIVIVIRLCITSSFFLFVCDVAEHLEYGPEYHYAPNQLPIHMYFIVATGKEQVPCRRDHGDHGDISIVS